MMCFQSGISKLREARNVVLELRNAAEEQQRKLTEKQENANTALNMISDTMKNTNVHKEKIEHLKLQTEQENMQLSKR